MRTIMLLGFICTAGCGAASTTPVPSQVAESQTSGSLRCPGTIIST